MKGNNGVACKTTDSYKGDSWAIEMFLRAHVDPYPSARQLIQLYYAITFYGMFSSKISKVSVLF